MKEARRWGVGIVICGCMAALPLWAESRPAQNSHQNPDAGFLKSAGQSMRAAVEFSNAVKNRTPKVTIRAYSESVIADSHQLNQRLIHLASREGVTVPVRLTAHEGATRKQLNTMASDGLDLRYAQVMMKQETEAIAQFRQEARDGADPLVKDFARNSLPTLQGLLSQAQEIADTSQR